MKKYIFFIIPILLIGCSSLPDESVNLLGIVFDKYNKPVEGAEVHLTGFNSQTDKDIFITDIDGRFIIPNMQVGNYSLRVIKNNFEPQNIDFSFFDEKQVLYCQLISSSYLKEQIEISLYNKNYTDASLLLNRLIKINENDPISLFLYAIYLNEVKEYDKCLTVLIKLEESGYKSKELVQFKESIVK